MTSNSANIIPLASRKANLKRRVRRHLQQLGFRKSRAGQLELEGDGKEIVRALHSSQRDDRIKSNGEFIKRATPDLLGFFADGADINPETITPRLERISAGTEQSDLFRLASLTWSVPVSNGFGRRLRYLVWDQSNAKLMGLLAIGDPVFNLRARDQLIGWDVHDRQQRLVNVMDAYVLGALPPYNNLLAGKLIACLLRTRDLYEDFRKAYGETTGIISQEEKRARLLCVTTSSSMGRSSVYNRLALNGTKYLRSIGYTGGWGHFHIPDNLFNELRNYLRDSGHHYADHHRFGNGPNWRLRTTRAALKALGFKDDMLRHGIEREVFITTLATNSEKILQSGTGRPKLTTLLTAKEVAAQALDRWVIPRAARRPDYQQWTKDKIPELLTTSRSIRQFAMRSQVQ